ncbi:potassium/proton antiporter [Capnocytophaga canis]|uniref:potassium/proton antiporter n=1 Tax=Capnocytophaga canis TaxID=1848903 RepID=UPI001562AD8F|nr:potassium/proton antiporter [Capnocytophaga canis]
MNLTSENILLVGSLLLLVSIVAGRTSYKFGVPTLILFLGVGMLAGSDGILKIEFNNPGLAQFIGILSLNFILFSGGLETRWKSVQPILGQGIMLSTVGVLLTAVFLGVFVWYVTDFTIFESLLLGSIVSSTDAAAVFSILRSKNLELKENLRPTLEFESGSNDPMAYVLTTTFLGLVQIPDQDLLGVIFIFLKQIILGGILGFIFGRLSKIIFNRISLGFEGLYPVLAIALMYITFSGTEALGGNGFLAIYVAAVYLGNHSFIHKGSVIKMFDGLAWLMQIVMFLTLGLLVNPSETIPLMGIGLLISVFLILVARPLSVFLGTLPFKMSFARRSYISWVGLRGAVPIVFATYPMLAGLEKANIIFNIVFFISVTSVLIQGTTLSMVAKWLNLASEQPAENEENPADAIKREHPRAVMQEIFIPEDCYVVDKKIVDVDFPSNAIIAMIKRKDKYITPNGSTQIEGNDTLIVISDNPQVMDEVRNALELES